MVLKNALSHLLFYKYDVVESAQGADEVRTNAMSNKKSSAKNDTQETFWSGMFSDKGVILLLGVGVFVLIINVLAFFLTDFRLSALLFHFDMRYWSITFSIFLWIAAIWVVLESTESLEDYLTYIRTAGIVAVTGGCAFVLYSYFGVELVITWYSLWFSVIAIIVLCCVIRSAYLLYVYWHEGTEYVDMEEAQWFWGVSGFLITALGIVGISHVIPVHVQCFNDPNATEMLFVSCYNGLHNLIRQGQGTLGIRMIGFLIFVASVAFAYAVGKWALVFVSRFRVE